MEKYILAGDNNYGQLGNENSGRTYHFVKTLRVENVVSISSQQNNMFLTQSGKILMCGYNINGELGRGTTGNTNTAEYVKTPDGTGYLEDVVLIASAHTPLAVTKNGKVYTWGYNSYGTIGDGTTAHKTLPVEVDLQAIGITKPKYIATAGHGNLIQDVSGKVFATGLNDYGKLAISRTPVNTNTKYMPMLDEDGNPFEDALIISNSAVEKVFGMISTSGNVYVAGRNEEGQFGNGTYQNSYLLERYGHNNLVLSDRQIYMKATTTKQVTISNDTFIFNTFENAKIDLEWSSSNESVATVSQDGTITGVGLGNCTIIAKDKNSGEESRVMVHVYHNKKGAMAVPMVTNSYDTYGAVMVLKEDGTVWATGYNANGELGQGNTIDRTQLVQVKIDNDTYLDNVVKVNYGNCHAIALTKNGEVYTWGLNSSGQLGLGDNTNRNYATKVTSIPGFEEMPKVIDVTAGYVNSSLLLEDGTVYTTGSGDYYSNGDGTGNTYNHFVKSSLIDNAVSMECDEWQRIILDADGTVWAFGCNDSYRLGDGTGTSRSVAVHVRNKLNENNLKHVISVKANMHSVALLEDKTAVGWGYNYYGNLGDGTGTSRSLPVDIVTYDSATSSYVQAKNIKDISTDYFVTMMIDENGNLLGTGLNEAGNLSTGNTTSPSRFTNMLNSDGTTVTDALFLSEGYSHHTTSIIRKDGTVWTAGTNSHGQYGDGTVTTTPGYYFTKAGTGATLNVRQQYIKIDDTFQLNIESDDFNVFIKEEDFKATNYNWSSYNEDVATVDANGVVTGKSVGHTTIIAENKENGAQARAVIYVTNKGDNVITVPSVVSSVNGSILVLKENGEVWGSGVNSNSELAQGDTTNRAEPVRIKTDENTYLENIIQLEVGQASAYALDKDGNVWSWGYNGHGQLGLGDTTNRTYATKVTTMVGYNTMPKVIQISAGYQEIQILLEDGQVYTAGRNNYGQLGNENYGQANNLVKTLRVENIVSINSGHYTRMYLTQTGRILTNGYGGYGDLGQAHNSNTNTVAFVKNKDNTGYLENVVEIAGGNHTVGAITKDEKVYVWGYNGNGGFGNGTTTNSNIPVDITDILKSVNGYTKAKYITSPTNTIAIQDMSGRIFSAGYNGYGRLSIAQVPVETNTEFKSVLDEDGNVIENGLVMGKHLSQNFGYISQTGTVYVAGKNEQGQFGNGEGTYQNASLLERYGHNNIELSERQLYLKATGSKKITMTDETQVFNVFENAKIDLEWWSSDENVATVSQDGTITGVALGECTIVAKDKTSGETSRVMVHVYNNKEGAITVPQTSGTQTGATGVLKEDGTLWTTGTNSYGELGLGDTVNRNEYQQVKKEDGSYLTGVVKFTMGWGHVVALTQDNEVYVWGCNTRGELGLGDTTNRSYATKLTSMAGFDEMPKVVDIATGYQNSLILLQDGTVYSTGNGDYGQNGDNKNVSSTEFNKVIYIDNAIKISGIEQTKGALDVDGTVWTWGLNGVGRCGTGAYSSKEGNSYYIAPIHTRTKDGNNNLKHVIDLDVNVNSMALLEDKTAVAWGHNYYGQTGIGTGDGLAYPVDVMTHDANTDTYIQAKNIKQIATSHCESLIILEGGELLGAGYNGNGQLATGNTNGQARFVNMFDKDGNKVTDAIYIGSGYSSYNNTLIRKDGTIWNSGINNYGGYGNRTNNTTPGYYFTKAGVVTVKLNADNDYIKIGEELDIDVLEAEEFNVFIPENFEQSDWTWESSNPDVATVDENGVVTGVSVGYTTISCYYKNGNMRGRAIINVYRNRQGAVTMPQVSNGDTFTAILKEDGTVWTTGQNNVGQLGDGTTTDRKTLGQVKIDENHYLENVKKISVGADYTIALTLDGEVYAWGRNYYGQLAQGNSVGTANQVYAVKMKIDDNTYISNAIDISASDSESMVLTEGGKVFVGGHNNHYQNLTTSSGNYYYLKDTGLINVVRVTGGYSNCGALLQNGEALAWGHNLYGAVETNPNPGLLYSLADDATWIEMAGYCTYVTKEDGTLWSTGYNNVGQLGLGDTTNRNKLTQVTLPEDKNGTTIKVKYVTTNGSTLMVQDSEGKVYVCGYNGYGQLCDGTTTSTSTLIPLVNQNGSEVTDCLILGELGDNSSYNTAGRNIVILRENGTAWIAGDNTWGQFGVGDTIAKKYLVQIGNSNVELSEKNKYIKVNETIDIDILKAEAFNVFIRDDQEPGVYEWSSSNDDVATVDKDGRVTGKSIGYTTITVKNTTLGITGRAIINVYRDKQGAVTMPQVANEDTFIVSLKEDGTVWASGANNVGQLGNGTTTNSSIPVQVKIDENHYLENVKKIAVGADYTIALTLDGDVYAWGYNWYGQLAQGDAIGTANQLYAVKMKKDDNTEITNAIDISVGNAHSVVLTEDGKVFVAGHNKWYQNLTIGRETYTYSLKDTGVTNGIKVTAGYNTCGVLLQSGETVGWGANAYGEIETNGNPGLQYTLAYDATWIEMRGYGTYIIKEDGSVWSTGYNGYGQLGLGDTANRNALTKVTLPEDENGNTIKAKYITANQSTLVVQDKEGKVYGCGYNGFGQLCDGTTTNTSTLIPLVNSNGSKVTDSLMLGELGNNSQYDVGRNIVILRQDGTVWAAGDNTWGQFGNRTTVASKALTKFGIDIVELNARNEYIKIDETLDIEVLQAEGFNVFIQDALLQSDFEWTSSNEDVATVDQDGRVTGKAVGHTTITGKNVKTGIKAKAIVNVYRNNSNAITVPQVEEGENWTAVLKEDGTVWTSGYNVYGQLGDGTTTNSNIPIQVKIDENTYLTNVKKIESSYYSILALTTDGEVYAWGYNDYGYLGQGDTTNRSYATKVKGINGNGYLENIIDMTMTHNAAVAIDKDGKIIGWGYGPQHALMGEPTTYVPIELNKLSGAITVDSGVDDVEVILSNGETWGWGHNLKGSLGNGTTSSTSDIIKIGNDITEIELQGYSGYILKEDKTVWSSGRNDYGQLGLGDTTERTLSTQVTLEDGTPVKAKTIEGGDRNLQFIGEDGKVYVTGYNGYGQLGDNTTTNAVYPMVMKNEDGTEVTDAISLIAGKCIWNNNPKNMGIIRKDGSVWLAGDNSYGQFGNNTTIANKILTKFGMDTVELTVRNQYIKIDEALDIDVLVATGFNVFIPDAPIQSDYEWTSSNEEVATIDNNGIVTGKSLGRTTITVKNPKTGIKGKAIINVYRNNSNAITVPQVENGLNWTVVLKEDGTVWTTGQNNVGQLGDGTTTNRNIPVQVKIDENTYLTNVRKISSSYAHTIALTADGEVYAWGYNGNGQLGVGDTTNRHYATKMKGVNGVGYLEDIIDITAGYVESYATRKDGTIYGTGYNYHFHITDDQVDKTTPVEVTKIKGAVQITCGFCDLGVICSNADVWVKGHNYYGAFGNGTTANMGGLYLVGKDINEYQLEGYSGWILREDGSVWSTGLNNTGQLGVGDTNNRSNYTPVKTKDEDGKETEVKAKTIKGGVNNFAYIGEDGKVYICGYNYYGQLGDGTTSDEVYPIIMKNEDGTEVEDAISLIVGDGYPSNGTKNTGIIRKDGTVWLAGDNTYGQIGNATNISTKYLTKMGDGFLNYPEKIITLGVGDTKNIDSSLFSIEEDMNVFVDNTTNLGNLEYESEDEITATVDNSGLITGINQGITRIKVTDRNTGAKTHILVKVTDDKNIQVSLGNRFTVALKQNGTLWSWGENHVGQLGLGNTTYYNEPQPITGIKEKIVDVKTGYYHSIALTENGEVYTWGYNYYGQLGNGNGVNSINPIKLNGLGKVTKIDAYQYMTIILNQAGEVYVWGYGYGANPVKLNFNKKIIDVAGNVVLAENRRAYDLTGNNSYGKDLVKISVGNGHYLGLTADGEVYGWGYNGYGELGNGNNISSNIATKVVNPEGTEPIKDIVDISAGDNYSIISDKDGKVYTFGNNAYYRLGQGDSRNKPAQIEDLSKIELVAASEGGHTLVADWDGFVYTVGLNDAGQLGLKDYTIRSNFEMVGEIRIESVPEKITLHVGDTQDVSLSLNSSFNLKSDKQNNSSVNKSIVNTKIASLSGDTVTGNAIGRTILNATYEGAIGTIHADINQYYRNIEVEVLPEDAIVVPKVENGNGFTASVKADGTVWTWGQNQYGQLGLGNNNSYNEPQKVNLTKTITNSDGATKNVPEVIKDIAVGNYQTLALSDSGKVYAWGLGNYGQIGVGNTSNQSTPVVVTDTTGKELEDIVKVEAGEDINFAITSKGVVYVWGKGYTARAQKLDTVDNIVDVTSKYVLTGEGKVYHIATKEELSMGEAIAELDEGTDHTVMLTKDGKAYSIGKNTYGQLGNGNHVASNDTPVAVKNSSNNVFENIKEIKAGDKTTVIVTDDGKVWTCGMNDNNELGIDNAQILDRNLPEVNDNIENVILATIGDNHVTVVKDDGSVYAWGNGKLGQLGNRKNKNSSTPVMVGDYIIRTNTNHVVLGVNDELIVEGNVDYFNLFNDKVLDISYNSKDNQVVELAEPIQGDVSDGKIGIKLVGKKVGTTIVTANQVDSSNIGVIQVEVIPENKEISPEVITNGSHTISLRVDGKVYTWGDNTSGQLGNGTNVSSDDPVEVKFPTGTIITGIASGENHNVAVDKDGNVWTWGKNSNYQIGHTGGDQNTPYKVTGLPKVIKVAAGNNNTMVITENNELYGWGLNANGDLGLGNNTNKVLPTKIEDIKDIIDIQGGKNHFIALNSAGEVYTTGSNLYGQLGIDKQGSNKVNEFEKVDLNAKIGRIDAGELASFAITVDGEVYTWGGNTYGNLGTGDKNNITTPTVITGVSDIRQVNAGRTHTVLRDGTHKVLVSGTNTYGQLGVGTKDNHFNFVENQKIDDVIRVSAGDTYTVFLREDGFVWACGDYNHGDINKKSRTNSKVPVMVGSDSSFIEELEMVIQKTETKPMDINDEFRFNLIYTDKNEASNFNYSSDNTDIAQINSDGDITGIREGTTWVRAVDVTTGKEIIAIVRVIDNNAEYTTHSAPKVVGGESFGIGLREDGTLWTWGYDNSGLADTSIPLNSNVLSTYKDVDAGKNHAIALREDGTVWTAGNNAEGQLGIGGNENKERLEQIGSLTDIRQIAAGETHSLAMDSYGIVYGWGSNAKGELSQEHIGKDTSKPVVITMANDRIIQIAAGKNQSAFVTAKGTVYAMGSFLNGYVPNVENAVKVAVGDNYILILKTDGTISKYQYGILTDVNNVSNAIDVSVQNKVNMYQSVDEKAYVWGRSSNSTPYLTPKTTPIQPQENSTNVFRIGSGYNNTFITANTGFVYAAGDNTHGELGNGTGGTKATLTGTTSKGSLEHTLVGDRNFVVTPETNTLEINEIEKLKIESNTFNVFKNIEKQLNEYDWDTEDDTVVKVLGDGEIQGVAEGTTNVVVTDKITGETKKVVRVVVPVDADRIESITANKEKAEVVSTYKYAVDVPMDDDETSAEVVIKTKLGTDELSVDDGSTWSKGMITTNVEIPVNTESIDLPFQVRTEAGNVIDYVVTINRVSKNNSLAEPGITVTNKKNVSATTGTDLNVTKVSDEEYEVIVPKTGIDTVTVTAANSKATVIVETEKDLGKAQYNITTVKDYQEVKITITSESGDKKEYVLKVYSEDYVVGLKEVSVNNEKATKKTDGTYEIYINDDIDLSEVKAITNLATAKVGIDGKEKSVNVRTEKVDTSKDETTVSIVIESEDGNINKTYTLKIYKNRVRSLVKEVIVDGNVITEVNGVYTAYVLASSTSAKVKITASDTDYYITLADFAEEQSVVEKDVVVDKDENTYKIKIRDSVTDTTYEYTLIIKRGNTVIGIDKVFAQNDNIIKNATKTGDKEYEVKILDTYVNTNLTVKAINNTAKVAIGQNDIDNETYGIGSKTNNIAITGDSVTVPVKIKTADDSVEEDYTVKIIRVSDDTSIKKISVNELLGGEDIEAVLSQTETDTYEVTLKNPVKKVDVTALVNNPSAEVKVSDNDYAKAQDTKQITIDSSVTQVMITVKSEYGTEKNYTLKIYTLPDDIRLQSVVVDGVNAVYNNNLGRYEVKIASTSNNYNVVATAEDQKANVTVDTTSGIGSATSTVNKTGKETIVPIKVSAQNGIAEKTYSLAIIEKSSDSGIQVVKVNGVEVKPEADGNYVVNVKSTVTDVEVFVQASNEFAKVSVDNTSDNMNKVTINRNLDSNPGPYAIEVIAENGTDKTTKTLTINRLSGDTNVDKIEVVTKEGTYTAELQEDGTYYCKIKREDAADVTVTLTNAEAKVSVAGGESANPGTGNVTLLNDLTEVNATITAEDGTLKTIVIKIQKQSNNANLKEVTAVAGTEVDYTGVLGVKYVGSDTYEIQVDDRLPSISVGATTVDSKASLKLATDTTYELNKITDKVIDLSTGTKKFEIEVLAEDGVTTKTYTVEITSKFNTTLLSVETDGEMATLSGSTYTGWLDRDDDANLVITPSNLNATISLYREGELKATATGVLTYKDELLTDTGTYKIVVEGPNEESSEYILNVTKKSNNNEIEYVKVNGETLEEDTETGNYSIEVGAAENDEYVLEVKAKDKYATVSFDGGTSYSESNTKTETYNIEPGETKVVNVVVKSQNGELTPKKVTIYRKDNNIDITHIKVNGNDIVSTYDSERKNYSITLANTEKTADLDILVASAKTTIESEIDGTNYSKKSQLEVEDISLPGVGKKVITFKVTAEDGTTDTRTITISQFSSNIELEKVTVNGKSATKKEGGIYEITIGDIPDTAEVYAKAVDSTSSVGINGNTATIGNSTVNIGSIVAGGPAIEVSIIVTAEDGSNYTYKLFITVKSGKTDIEYVKVNGEEATKLSDTQYRMFVPANSEQATVELKAAEPATITVTLEGKDLTQNVLTFPQTLENEKTIVPFIVTSEGGDIKECTLEIIKESEDNTLSEVYVNGTKVEKDPDTGRYAVTIKEEDGNPVVKAVTNNEFAYVRIGLFDEEQKESERTVTLGSSKVTTVPITVRSQTGESKVEYLDITVLHAIGRLDKVVVDDVEVTNYDEETKTYVAIVDENIENHEIFIMSSNAYAKLEIKDEVGIGNVTVLEQMGKNEAEKSLLLTVTAENGESEQYTIKLVQKSTNVNVSKLLVNDIELTPDEDDPNIYRMTIKKLDDKAKIKVITDYPYATVKVGENTETLGNTDVWVDLDLLEDVITIPVIVTASDGETVATYNVILIRASNDTSAEVSYDGKKVEKAEDGKYYVNILDTVETGQIKVVANKLATADINDTTVYENIKNYELSIDLETAGRTINVPISIKAQDGTEEKTELVITRISTNSNTEKVEGTFEVGGNKVTKTATKDKEGNYIIPVNLDTSSIDLKITAESDLATIEAKGLTNKGTLELSNIALTDKETIVTYKVIAEAGEPYTVTKTIKIVKQSSDVSLLSVEIDGQKISTDDNGVYRASVVGGTKEVNAILTANSKAATVSIGDNSNVEVLTTKLGTTALENTYTIKVTSESGKEATYQLVITRQTNIVGKILTENAEGKHKSTVYVYKTSDTKPEDPENYLLPDKTINTNVREIIDTVETNEDGTFVVQVPNIEQYDIVVMKSGYLDYRVLKIGVTKGEKTELDEYKLMAGDVRPTNEIQIDDLVALNDNFGVTITEVNKAQKAIYDLNEDGTIDKLDRNILKKNYGKKAKTVTWVDPNAVATEVEAPSMMSLNTKAQSNVTEKKDFIVPMKCDYMITSPYGYRTHPTTGEYKKHTGIDLGGTWHTEILAVADGEVVSAGVQTAFGNCIEIKHTVNGKTIYSFYAHLSKINVKAGDKVTQGQVIGLEGGDPNLDSNPGYSTGHHLHFELRSASGYGNDIDPNDYIKFNVQ